MKFLIITMACIISIGSFAQENESNQKTLFGSDKKSLRVYVALNHKAIELNNQMGLMTGGEFSLVFNHKFNLGVFGYGMFNTVQSNFINPNYYKYNYGLGMGGIKIEPVFFSNAIIHFTTPIEMGMGGISLNKSNSYYNNSNDVWETNFYDYDMFSFIEPSIKAEINLFKNLRFSGGVGYQFTDVVNLAETKSYPINGFVANVSLKLGWF